MKQFGFVYDIVAYIVFVAILSESTSTLKYV
jgi:hypothetical protein